MIRIGDPTLFQLVRAGELAEFPNVSPRNVRVTVNTVGRTSFHVVALDDDGTIAGDVEPMFLASIDGLDEIEFYAHGPFAIEGDGDFMLKTIDGSTVHASIPDAVSMTRIAERRARNPEIERLQAMLLHNQERRMGAMYDEIAREREKLELERAAYVDSRTRSHEDGGGSAEPPANGGASGEHSPANGGGEEGTDDGS